MSKTYNILRITGGNHRSRRLPFIPKKALRPTTDRVRETVFNWLQGQIIGYKVLDLFAGSGILGLEALSRGASQAIFVDHDQTIVRQLQRNIKKLNIDKQHAQVFYSDAFNWLEGNQTYFDLVFLDPPFCDNFILRFLKQSGSLSCLSQLRWIYLEQSVYKDWPNLSEPWCWYRQKIAGQVKFALLKRC